MGWIFQHFQDWFSILLFWLFDPVKVYSGAVALVGHVMEVVLGMFGTSTTLFDPSSGALGVLLPGAFNLALWWMSPVLDPGVVKICLSVTIYVWMIQVAIKFALYIKGHFWSSSH